ncbi:MAG: sugar phosphate nucleotidyltransferase [Rubritalea sp.]|uniref:phosphocholine cytidylyltransferase family protein n=1 Tax=Rubritalea sp. TaxID=2109375 RepID=UPI0032426A35
MKIFILAAGKGERLWPLTKDNPKPLVDVGGGVTLLDEQLKRLSECGVVDEVVVVTGYLGHKVDEKVAQLNIDGIELKTLYNPFFRQSNNLASLWMAQHEMHEDFMVTNGDNLFNKGVFRNFSEACVENGIYLSVGAKSDFDVDDMKVTLRGECVTNVSKEIVPEKCHAESPGLCLVRGEAARKTFRDAMRSELTSDYGLHSFWLTVFRRIAEEGTCVKPWFFDAQNRWREVDIHPDLKQMKLFLSRMVQSEGQL